MRGMANLVALPLLVFMVASRVRRRPIPGSSPHGTRRNLFLSYAALRKELRAHGTVILPRRSGEPLAFP